MIKRKWEDSGNSARTRSKKPNHNLSSLLISGREQPTPRALPEKEWRRVSVLVAIWPDDHVARAARPLCIRIIQRDGHGLPLRERESYLIIATRANRELGHIITIGVIPRVPVGLGPHPREGRIVDVAARDGIGPRARGGVQIALEDHGEALAGHRFSGAGEVEIVGSVVGVAAISDGVDVGDGAGGVPLGIVGGGVDAALDVAIVEGFGIRVVIIVGQACGLDCGGCGGCDHG